MINSSAYTENIDYLTSALSINPQTPDAIKAAKYYLQNGDSKKAILLCEDSLKFHAEYLTGYLTLINAYISNSDYTSAQSTLEKANKIFPNHWAFKPILRKLDDFGYDEKHLYSSLIAEDIMQAPHKEVVIDENDMDSIVEESKTGSIVDSFDIDNYINDAAIEEIDKPQVFDANNLNFPDEYLTINDFKPTGNNFTAHDEIINSILDDNEDTSKYYKRGNSFTTLNNSNREETQPIKVFNEKFNIENELNQLLSEEDLQKAPNDSLYEEIENQENHTTPKLISRTLAEVYDMQGRFAEAIEVYKALLKNNEITSQECESIISSLQEKISTNIDI